MLLCNIFTRQQSQAFSINKTEAHSSCRRFTPRRLPVARGLHFTGNSSTNTAHGKNKGTKAKKNVSLCFFLSSTHATECTACCDATIAVWEMNLKDRSARWISILLKFWVFWGVGEGRVTNINNLVGSYRHIRFYSHFMKTRHRISLNLFKISELCGLLSFISRVKCTYGRSKVYLADIIEAALEKQMQAVTANNSPSAPKAEHIYTFPLLTLLS